MNLRPVEVKQCSIVEYQQNAMVYIAVKSLSRLRVLAQLAFGDFVTEFRFNNNNTPAAIFIIWPDDLESLIRIF